MNYQRFTAGNSNPALKDTQSYRGLKSYQNLMLLHADMHGMRAQRRVPGS